MRALVWCIAPVLLSAACGHTAMRGSVVMKISDTQAHVCMGNKEVAVGDQVQLVLHDCTRSSSSKPTLRQCKPVVISRGRVTEVLNDHYSVVDFPAGVVLREGDSVEKTK